ncbi:oligosaccharide flippase family protein [Pseudomonas sp. L1(2025)]|uniref:oligosaccharide flippase family protein n=1 Tax=Pseudomonas sp. L1(2025) TaxID=3449429 RepID=UPI003F690359
MGQLQSFLQMTAAGACAMTSTGVVKLVSEGRQAESKVIKASFFLLSIYTVFVFLILWFFFDVITEVFLGGQWGGVLLSIPVAAFFLGLGSLFISYYNGRQDYRRYFIYSILVSMFTAVAVVLCVLIFGFKGAIYSVVIAPICAGVIILACFRGWMNDWKVLSTSEFSPLAKSLLQFSLMAVGSALVVYGGQIYLRQFITSNLSATAAGIWYSATRLSDIYIGISSVLFSTVLLPKYSGLAGRLLTSEVMKMLVFGLMFSLVLVLAVNVVSGWTVNMIYGPAFDLASRLLDIYVVGDALKVVSWIFLYVLISKQKVIFYLVYEVFSAVVYVVLSMLALKYVGFDNMALGYVVQVSVSLVILLCWFFKFSRDSVRTVEADD